MTLFSKPYLLPRRSCAAASVGLDALVHAIAALPGARATPIAAAGP